MVDRLKSLPVFRWRGRPYAITSRRVSFRQGNVEHPLERKDNAEVESTGAENLVLEYTLAVRDGLMRGPYGNSFTIGYRILFNDCFNEEKGELIDPLLGAKLCKVVSLDDMTDVRRRDGTDVTVQFIHTPEDADSDTDALPTAKTVDSQAATVAAVTVEVTGQAAGDPAAPVEIEEQQSLIDILTAAEQIVNAPRNILNSYQGAAARSEARLNRIAGVAKTLEEYATQGVGPVYWDMEQRSRDLRDSATVASRNQSQVSPVRVFYTEQEQTVSALANSLGVSVDALMAANPRLSRYPLIPTGFSVVVPNARR